MLKFSLISYKHLPLIAIICLSIGLFLNTFHHEFVNFDDLDLIVRNHYIRSLSMENIKAIFTPGVVGAYQPVRTLSYALDYHIWRLNPTGYHLTNILCHALNTLLVYMIFFKLSQQILMTVLASLLFAIHPVHVEAVTWVAGRRDVLSTMFALAAFLCAINTFPFHQEKRRSFGRTVGWYLFALLLFTAGILTKASIVVFPVLLLLYILCFSPSIKTHWRKGFASIPFFLIAGVVIQAFLSVAQQAGVIKSVSHTGDAFTRFLTMIRVFGEYILMLFVPRNLSVTYGITSVSSVADPSFLLSSLILIVVLIATIIAWKKSKMVFFGVGWFFSSLLPVSNIIPVAITKADRYLYLPSVGFCLVFAWLIVQGWKRIVVMKGFNTRLLKIGYWVMIGVLVLSYTMYTVQRNRDWKDSHTLWTATLETNPDSSIALNNLGLIYAEQGMYDKAIALYEQLLSFHPDQEHVERVYNNMGDAYAGMQEFDEAINHYQQALNVDPEYVNAYLGLGRVSLALGQTEEAERIYTLALEIDDRNEAVYNHLGNLYAMQGNYDEAITMFEHTLKLNPFSVNAYNGLGLSYFRHGESAKALEIYQQALRNFPESTLIRNSLGSLYMELGESEKAITQFTAILEREPDNVEVRNNLGILYLRAERYEDAARQFMSSLTYEPDNPRVISNLGNTYVYLGLYEQAIQMYQWAVELDPSLLKSYLYLGDLCFGMGDMDCAIEAYQGVLRLQPENQKAREQLEAARQKKQENAQ